MFENFTFGAQAQTAHHEPDDDQASPTDTTCVLPPSSPPAHCPFSDYTCPGINDIVNQFSQQTIRPDDIAFSESSMWQNPLANFSFDNDFTEDDFTHISATRGRTTFQASTSLPCDSSLPSRGGNASCKRLQRQLNTQLQTCSNHVRDINSLVEEMIVTNSQCNLRRSTSRPYLSSPPPAKGPLVGTRIEDLVVDNTEYEIVSTFDEDEGFAELEDDGDMSLRCANTPSGIRKHPVVRYRPNLDAVRSAACSGIWRERKVRCIPRMRRRKVGKVPEE